jgi:CMP-N-acetylneuraminic acid synthetase
VKRNLAIIPARAGSKRIKDKNIIELNGKSMIAWTIEAALESGIFDDVLVSTDGAMIAEIAKKHGASVPFLRDIKDADDYVSVNQATINALLQMENHSAESYENVVQLMPNCPCRGAGEIRQAFDNFIKNKSNSQISVFKFGWMNPWWAMKVNKNMNTEPVFPEALKKRSQDLDELYCPTGAIWIAKAEALKKNGTFYGPGYNVHELNWESAVDIDEPADLRMAELIMIKREREK